MKLSNFARRISFLFFSIDFDHLIKMRSIIKIFSKKKETKLTKILPIFIILIVYQILVK